MRISLVETSLVDVLASLFFQTGNSDVYVDTLWSLYQLALTITKYSKFCYCSLTKLCLTLCNPMDCSTQGCPVLHCLLEFAHTHIHWVSDAIQPSHPVIPFTSCPQSFTASVFSHESALHIRCSKYWSFGFSNSPSNEYSELISLRIDWFDFLAVQGTLESLLQHHSLKASILWCSAFLVIHF